MAVCFIAVVVFVMMVVLMFCHVLLPSSDIIHEKGTSDDFGPGAMQPPADVSGMVLGFWTGQQPAEVGCTKELVFTSSCTSWCKIPICPELTIQQSVGICNRDVWTLCALMHFLGDSQVFANWYFRKGFNYL